MEFGPDRSGAAPAEPASRKFLLRPKAGTFVAPAHGFIPVFLILVLFLLAAIYVKPLFFGILAAILSFRCEQFLERRFFGTRFMRGVHNVFVKLNAPFAAFRRRISRKIVEVPEAEREDGGETPSGASSGANPIPPEDRRRIAARASAMTVILAVILTILLFWSLFYFISPFASMSGESMSRWAHNNNVIEKLERKIAGLLDRIDPPQAGTAENAPADTPESAGTSGAPDTAEPAANPPDTAEEVASDARGPAAAEGVATDARDSAAEAGADRTDDAQGTDAHGNVRDRLRNRISAILEENNITLAKFTFRAGNELLKNAFHLTAWAGTFAFDLVMFLFFYYYFLLKMAVFAAGREDPGQNLGEWTVSSIYQSGWLPDASESERSGAARIIDHIYGMFRAWLVGYFWIIVLETILYALIFIPFNVPFWPILALIAGSTILLPFLGPVLAAILSVAVTILFAQEGIVMPIIGIALAYLLIHVILEQLLLYPMLVGEAIGLTLVETIIVVLLGAVVAGISGMILAVPAAALLKLLVPLFYQTLNARRRRRTAQAQKTADPGA